MEKPQQTHRPQLFVLRVWLEELGAGQKEWRGDIQHTASREKRYFREWSMLLDFLQDCCEQRCCEQQCCAQHCCDQAQLQWQELPMAAAVQDAATVKDNAV